MIERSVVIAMFADNTLIDEIVNESMFTEQLYREIFIAQKDLRKEDKIVNSENVFGYFSKHFKNYDSGFLIGILADLDINDQEAVKNFSDMLGLMSSNEKEKSVKDILLNASSNIAKMDIDELTRKVVSELNKLENPKGFAKNCKHDEMEFVEYLESLEDQTFVETGFKDLDSTIRIRPGNLIVAAARPAMGKTAWAMNVANNAINNGKKVLVVSLEMTFVELLMRLFSIRTRICGDRLNRMEIEEFEMSKLQREMIESSETRENLFIADKLDRELTSIVSKIKGMHRKEKFDLVIIDYIGLMRCSKYSNNKVQEVSEITAELKTLAVKLEVPIIALSQLNRKLETRDDKRPMMADLRDSGSIEQDADIICFLYRDEVYYDDSADKGICEILVEKNRHGKGGTVKLGCQLEYYKFKDLQIDNDIRF